MRDGKFFAVGNDEEILALKNQGTEVVDLQGKIIIPGFNDNHIHIWKVGNLLTYMLDLRGVRSREEMLDKIRDYAHANPQLEWIQARGFNEVNFSDQRMPNKHDLDAISTTRPICITRTCAHQIVVNSKALEICKIDRQTISPPGGEIKLLQDGSIAGHFTETAIGLVLTHIPKYSAAQLRQMVLAAQDEFLSMGITSATDPAVDKDLLDVYISMDRNNELKIKINAIPIRVPDGSNKIYPLPQFYSGRHLKVDTVKFFADGGISGKTAALKIPYQHTDEKGVLRIQRAAFKKLAEETQAGGFRIATHAIGDTAIEMVVSVLNEIAFMNDADIRHRIEHLGLPSQHDLWLMKELNISAVMQPVFIYELGKNFRNYLDHDYLNRIYPLQNVLEHGICLSLSTDAPVVKNYDPIVNIRFAMQRRDEEGVPIAYDQRLSFEAAISAYTRGSAEACGDLRSKGTIRSGAVADFIIADHYTSDMKISSVYADGTLHHSGADIHTIQQNN